MRMRRDSQQFVIVSPVCLHEVCWATGPTVDQTLIVPKQNHKQKYVTHTTLCGCVAAACGIFVLGNHSPGLVEHIYCPLCCIDLGALDLFFVLRKVCNRVKWLCQQTCIEMICKKVCCIAPNHFPRSDFLGNSLKRRTLAFWYLELLPWFQLVPAFPVSRLL